MSGSPVRPVARPADDTDAAEIERLRGLARAEIAEQRGGPALLLESSEPSAAQVFIGTIGAAVVGLLVAEVVPDGASRLTTLYVEPGARRVGVGAALVDVALSQCGAAGSTSVDAEALPGDRSTKNFFEAYGFVTRRLTVRRDLRADG